MKITTIQLYEDTKRKIESKKVHPRESYDSVLRKMIESEEIPSMEDMFRQGDKVKQAKEYSTEQIIKISHELRQKR